MGIIDNFAFRIKNILTKGFLDDKNVEWLSKIQNIVNQYNSDGTAGLGGIAPNDAHKQELPPPEEAKEGETEEEEKQRVLRNKARMSNYQIVLNMNLSKQKANNQISNLAVDDKVRVSTQGRSQLQKGTDPKWSDKVFNVTAVKGNTITLDNNQMYKRNDLLKVPENTTSSNTNPIDKEKALQAKLKQKLRKQTESKQQTIKKLLGGILKHKQKQKEKKQEPTSTVVPLGGGSSSSSSSQAPAPAAEGRFTTAQMRRQDPLSQHIMKYQPKISAEQKRAKLTAKEAVKALRDAKTRERVQAAAKKEIEKQRRQLERMMK